jgi:hypothetical protein
MVTRGTPQRAGATPDLAPNPQSARAASESPAETVLSPRLDGVPPPTIAPPGAAHGRVGAIEETSWSRASAPAPGAAVDKQGVQGSRHGAGTYLAETTRLLRTEHAPAAALRTLDQHRAELAQAGFDHEALILRVEALLALNRRAEVLRFLDGAALADVAASRALLVTRGQLRAAAHRCADAMGDFELVLARSRQVDRQALEGRAICRKNLGDLDGSRADGQRLRNLFPNQPLPAELAP